MFCVDMLAAGGSGSELGRLVVLEDGPGQMGLLSGRRKTVSKSQGDLGARTGQKAITIMENLDQAAHSVWYSHSELVANIFWLRICLPLQGRWVQSLVHEDSTCHEAAKSMCHC